MTALYHLLFLSAGFLTAHCKPSCLKRFIAQTHFSFIAVANRCHLQLLQALGARRGLDDRDHHVGCDGVGLQVQSSDGLVGLK